VAARRADADTTFVCALGDDAGGALARALAARDDIALRVAASTQPTGAAGIFVDADGRNSILVGAGANADLDAAFVAAQADALSGARVVLAQLESPVEAIATALRLARDAGALALLNPAPADAPTTPALLAQADVLTPNETEFAALLQRHAPDHALVADAVATTEDARLHAACRYLLPHGTVIVTLGAAGCFVSHPAPRWGDADACYRVSAPPARVIDTTGAGDAFNGALAAALAATSRAAFADHVRFASRYAALSTEAPGAAASMPLRADVLARFGPEPPAP
jgi:ribokinase